MCDKMKPADSIEVEKISQQIEISKSSVSTAQPSPQAPAQPKNLPQPHPQPQPKLGVYKNIIRSKKAAHLEVQHSTEVNAKITMSLWHAIGPKQEDSASSQKAVYEFQVINLQGEKWGIGAIFGGTKILTSYYINLIKLNQEDQGSIWKVGECKMAIMENSTRFKASPLLKNIWTNLADSQDISAVELVDAYLKGDELAAFEALSRKSIRDKLAELGKFANTLSQPRNGKRHRETPERYSDRCARTFLLSSAAVCSTINKVFCDCKLSHGE